MGKKRLAKYLASKPEGEYSHLDKILKAYADGEAAQLLSKYEFYDTQITFQIVKNDNNLQIDGKYYNLAINISFLERGYEYAIYPLDKRIKQIEDRFETHTYEEGDTAESIITKIHEKLQSHPELVIGPIPKNRRKLYALLSAFFFLLPFIVVGGMALYGFINDVSVYGDWWMVILFFGFCISRQSFLLQDTKMNLEARKLASFYGMIVFCERIAAIRSKKKPSAWMVFS